MSKHAKIYQIVSNKVGLNEDSVYKEYFNPQDLYGESLWYLAARNFKRFVAIIYFLIKEKGEKFDVIVGPGDSGIGLAKVTELIYKVLNVESPLILYLPIVRWEPKWLVYSGQKVKLFDNSVIFPTIKNQIRDLKQLSKILIVDDEIKNGITVGEAVKVVLGQQFNSKKESVIIVAEDQGFNPDKLTNAACEFYFFAKSNTEINNVLSYLVPWNIEKVIREPFNDLEISSKVAFNSLLNIPSKEFQRFKDYIVEKPNLTNEYILKLEKAIPNFSLLQDQFEQLVTKLIKDAILEYEN